MYIADRTVTAGTAFLGLTFECSRCHDHKYDPISQKDFYSLASYFADIDEHGLYSHFTRATPTPALALFSPEEAAKDQRLIAEIKAREKTREQWILQHRNQPTSSDASPPKPTWEFPLEGSETGIAGQSTKFNGDDASSFALNLPHPTEPAKTIQRQFGRETPLSFSLWVYPCLLYTSPSPRDS